MTDEVVFLGGASVSLWISDPAAPPVRATNDVDVVLAATYGQLDAFAARLRERGFAEDRQVICRYRHPAGLILDVMPIDSQVLGFGNRWYADAVTEAASVVLPSGTSIRAVRPPWLIATKLEAFLGRGGDDPLASADFEDLVRLVDGREELHAEIEAAPGRFAATSPMSSDDSRSGPTSRKRSQERFPSTRPVRPVPGS